MDSDYYTLKEAAKLLGVDPTTVKRNIDLGKIKGKKVLGRWKVEKASVDNLRS